MQHTNQEQAYDRYKDHPELLADIPKAAPRLFSYNWSVDKYTDTPRTLPIHLVPDKSALCPSRSQGYVSPFRPTPQDLLAKMLTHVSFSSPNHDTLLDLGCGDGLVLLQALVTFPLQPEGGLKRAIGVDLDKDLLKTASVHILETVPEADRSRLELYHGDLTLQDEPLDPILTHDPCPSLQTMGRLLANSSHLFVYLLPEALAKLSPLLLKAVAVQHKMVLSMRWEIPGLAPFLLHGGPDNQYYIYYSA